MPTLDETIGMALAIEKSNLPYIISFMVRENGTIPDGITLINAMETVDNEVLEKPLCYMANCVHPRIVKSALELNDCQFVRERFKGIQANAAYLSPEELDRPSETISSSAEVLANEMVLLREGFPLKIYGGCCGTDDTHLYEFARRMKAL
ncbi:MAG: homocysteine S-methyltransferase family protein [Oscillospiraceae bacterium]